MAHLICCLFKYFIMVRFHHFLRFGSVMFSEPRTLSLQFQSDPEVTDEERADLSSFGTENVPPFLWEIKIR